MVNLTPNAVSMLFNRDAPDGFEPWLQVIDTKRIKPASGSGADRYRTVLSDGSHYITGMLATQLAHLMETEQLQPNCAVQLKDYIGNDVQGRRIIIVLNVGEIVPMSERIGDPQSIEGGRSAPPAAPAASSYQPPPPPQQPQKPVQNYNAPPTSSYSNKSAPVVKTDPNVRVTDIASLNPYAGGRWTIKARVTSRAPIKHWNNARGQGKLFSVDLLDAKGGEIRAAFFQDAVDKFYELLRPGNVFFMSGGRIKLANRRFSSVNNDYEITFDASAEVSPANEDASIEQVKYHFKKIEELERQAPDSTIDVIAVVKDVGPVNEITSKAGKQLFKRDLTLVDDSNAEIKCTLWNERAQEDCSSWAQNVIALKGCRVSDFNGRSLGTLPGSSCTINPPIPEAGQLLNWFNNGGSSVHVKALSGGGGAFGGGGGLGSFNERAVLADVKGKQLGYGQKPDYVTVKASVKFIKHDNNVSYQACPKCQKKMTQDYAQNFVCEKCQTSYDRCENRYVMSTAFEDHTGTTWTTCFNEQGKVVLGGKSADEMMELREQSPALFDAAFKEALFRPYLLKLRVKAENVMDELRVKCSVTTLEPLDFAAESRELLQAIDKYN